MERIEQVCERRAIPIGKLVQNNGQIDGVPKNPRTWEPGDVERLAKSIEETPELLDARGLIVVPHGGKFVVIGGNMRLAACRQLKLKELPCMVLPEDTDAERLKAIAIKDNGSFGAWDFEALKLDDWDPVLLEECGVELLQIQDVEDAIDKLNVDTVAKPMQSEGDYISITFCFERYDAEIVKDYINDNGKDNLIKLIVELCQEQGVK